MGHEIVILTIMKKLKNRLSLILSIAVLSVLAVGLLLVYVTGPVHHATSQLLVERTPGGHPSIGFSMKFRDSQMDTYAVLLKSPDVLENVIKELGLQNSITELHEKITISSVSNSQVLNITVSQSDGKEAVNIANTLAAVFEKEVRNMMKTNNVTIISQASEKDIPSPFGENLLISLGIAGAFGLIVGTLLAFIVELLDTLVKTGESKRKKPEAKLQSVFK